MNVLRWFGTLLGVTAATAGSAAQPTPPKNEHAVIVHFAYGSKDLTKLFALEDELEKAILATDAGEFDGNKVAVDGSDGYLYMYGPNADNLFAVIKPVLQKTPFMRGAKAKLRYGSPQASTRERTIAIDP